MLAALVVLRPLLSGSNERAQITLCSAADRRVTALGGVAWEPCITQAPALGMQFWNGDFEQGTEAGKIDFTFNLEQARKTHPQVINAVWMGAIVEVAIGKVGTPWPWKGRFRGRVTAFAGAEYPAMRITASVDTEPFTVDVLSRTYAGTTGAEGGTDLKDRIKPLALGRPLNVEPVLIDAVDSVYQFSAYGPIEAVETLFERASAFPAASGDYPTFAALVAAEIDPGHWATCLAEGMIRLGAPAAGVITADIRGHAVDGIAPRGAGALVALLADLCGIDPDLIARDRLAALDAEGATFSDVMITDQVSFLDAARRLILPCNWQVVVTNLGVLLPMKPDIARDVSLVLHAQGRREPLCGAATEEAVSVPYKKTVMAAERCWRTHTLDEIASDVPLIYRGDYAPDTVYRAGNIVTMPGGARWKYISDNPQKGITPGTDAAIWVTLESPSRYSDGTPIDVLQPLEPGSDVTSTVEGVAAHVIKCDYLGTPLASEIPRESQYKFYRNGLAIVSGVTWSVNVIAGTVTASIDGTGLLNVTSLGSDAKLQIVGVYGETTRSIETTLQKQLAPPPAGMGPTGGTSVYASINAIVTDSMEPISPELSITIGTDGEAALSALYGTTRTSGSGPGSGFAYAAWYRWNGSVYAPMQAEVMSTSAATTSEPGEGAVSTSLSGLAANTVERFRLYARSAASGVSLRFGGSASAVGT